MLRMDQSQVDRSPKYLAKLPERESALVELEKSAAIGSLAAPELGNQPVHNRHTATKMQQNSHLGQSRLRSY
jgi:hypothetical protein